MTHVREATGGTRASSEGAAARPPLAGVTAARAGEFGCVIGVDRVGIGDELLANGADIVVSDLGELLVGAER
ncbi:hypothetical protein [uncultured Demequina sp.]|uniref:hypothetical protein n=1 Tax=uncultured Demequina sp. TaxID=693499 RepID=UPI0025FC6EF7|nr:hypothetical protein [uncultured Demequina sp.]